MKICMIAYAAISDSRVQRYTRALLERGDEVDFIGLEKKIDRRYQTKYPIPQYTLCQRNYNQKSFYSYLKPMLRFFILALLTCTRLHLRKRYDIIHFHNVPDFGVFCTLIPKLMGSKIILDIHDIVPEFYMRKFDVSSSHLAIRLLKWIEKISASYADHVITVTEIWRKRLVERSVSLNKCTVILNAPDPLIFRRKNKVKRKTQNFTLSYHGNFTEPTGVDVAIKAVAIAKKEIPDIRFQIIGNGREIYNLKRLIKQLQLKDNIVIKKSIPNEYIPEVLARVDVGIDPKKDGVYAGETLSVKAMEYLALGVPLIVSRTKAAQLYFDDSMVMFFEPDNENDLARCIIELYRSPKKRKGFIKTAKLNEDMYSWEKYKNIYLDLTHRLLLSK